MLAVIGSQIGQFMKRKQAEEAVLQERHLLTTIMDTVPDSIYFKDIEGCFIRVNRAMARRSGLADPAEAVGKTDFDFFTEEHAERGGGRRAGGHRVGAAAGRQGGEGDLGSVARSPGSRRPRCRSATRTAGSSARSASRGTSRRRSAPRRPCARARSGSGR